MNCQICGKELKGKQSKYCSSRYCLTEAKKISRKNCMERYKHNIENVKIKKTNIIKTKSINDYTHYMSVDMMLEINRNLITLKKTPADVYNKFCELTDKNILKKHIERVCGHCLKV